MTTGRTGSLRNNNNAMARNNLITSSDLSEVTSLRKTHTRVIGEDLDSQIQFPVM